MRNRHRGNISINERGQEPLRVFDKINVRLFNIISLDFLGFPLYFPISRRPSQMKKTKSILTALTLTALAVGSAHARDFGGPGRPDHGSSYPGHGPSRPPRPISRDSMSARQAIRHLEMAQRELQRRYGGQNAIHFAVNARQELQSIRTYNRNIKTAIQRINYSINAIRNGQLGQAKFYFGKAQEDIRYSGLL